ncbi:MAG TPA: Fur family transcriptional regulator [Candidatus Bathyarchaeia archaeon]|nr:Fur family transcriptional regulator [Candidatus Bathyarchaeia archaeon]
MKDGAKLRKILQANGYSLTHPRLAVFTYLSGKEPISMSTLCQALVPDIDRASVYRTVTLFQKLGITKRHAQGWKYMIELGDMFAEHHHHFTCINCGSIVPIGGNSLENFIEQLASRQGFVATGHQIEIQGYCSRCEHLDLRK